MKGHTVNLLPERGTPATRQSPWPSVAFTALLMLGMVAGGWWAGPEPVTPAEAAAPPASSPVDRCRLPADDAVVPALRRAAEWRPWPVLMSDLGRLFDGHGALTELRYDGNHRRVRIMGHVRDAHTQLPHLMLKLGEYCWLREPRLVALNDQQFTIEVTIAPFVAVEAP